jgi:hypothetical protein
MDTLTPAGGTGGIPVWGGGARVGVLHLAGPGRDGTAAGAGLLREAMTLRGRMNLASYDRLFPSQDLLPAGGLGNLIASPLYRPAPQNGSTVFLHTVIRACRCLTYSDGMSARVTGRWLALSRFPGLESKCSLHLFG